MPRTVWWLKLTSLRSMPSSTCVKTSLPRSGMLTPTKVDFLSPANTVANRFGRYPGGRLLPSPWRGSFRKNRLRHATRGSPSFSTHLPPWQPLQGLSCCFYLLFFDLTNFTLPVTFSIDFGPCDRPMIIYVTGNSITVLRRWQAEPGNDGRTSVPGKFAKPSVL